MRNDIDELTLTDALAHDGISHEPINVYVEEITLSGSDGILIGFQGGYPAQVVIENKEGKLVCHVWATNASLGNDPTHSIEIERPTD